MSRRKQALKKYTEIVPLVQIASGRYRTKFSGIEVSRRELVTEERFGAKWRVHGEWAPIGPWVNGYGTLNDFREALARFSIDALGRALRSLTGARDQTVGKISDYRNGRWVELEFLYGPEVTDPRGYGWAWVDQMGRSG